MTPCLPQVFLPQSFDPLHPKQSCSISSECGILGFSLPFFLLSPSSKSQGGRARWWRVSSSLPTTTPVSRRESAIRASSIGPKTIKNKQNAGRFFFPCSSWSPSRTSSPKQLWRPNVKISKLRKRRPMMTFSAHEWARRNVKTRQKTHHQDVTAPCSHTLWKLE